MDVIKQKCSLVSCITTTYRKFAHLYQTLDSVFEQTYPNIELIVGDDGSPDFPEKEIRDYIEKNRGRNITNVIIHHEEENHGTVYNCALCRELANGEYIMGLASDDRFHDRNVVTDVIDYFQETGAQVITCIRQIVEERTDRALACLPSERQQRMLEKLSPQKLFEEMCSFPFISGSSTYYTKEFYNRMGKYDSSYKYIEDVPFYLKVLRNGEKIHFYPRKVIWYRYGDGISTIPRKSNRLREEMYRDRIRYMSQEIMPYADNMPRWRKEHLKVRSRRFMMERETENKSIWEIYLELFRYSPIGTLVQIYYQQHNKNSVKKR